MHLTNSPLLPPSASVSSVFFTPSQRSRSSSFSSGREERREEDKLAASLNSVVRFNRQSNQRRPFAVAKENMTTSKPWPLVARRWLMRADRTNERQSLKWAVMQHPMREVAKINLLQIVPACCSCSLPSLRLHVTAQFNVRHECGRPNGVIWGIAPHSLACHAALFSSRRREERETAE